MAKPGHHDRLAKKLKRELIRSLGGKCAHCSTKEDLAFDHIIGRNWDVSLYSKLDRLRRYRREAQNGLIQLLCRQCNARKGDPIVRNILSAEAS